MTFHLFPKKKLLGPVSSTRAGMQLIKISFSQKKTARANTIQHGRVYRHRAKNSRKRMHVRGGAYNENTYPRDAFDFSLPRSHIDFAVDTIVVHSPANKAAAIVKNTRALAYLTFDVPQNTKETRLCRFLSTYVYACVM